MSVQMLGWVLDASPTTGSERLVLLSIANHADADGDNAWPSVERIAREANISKRSAQRAIGALVEAGALVVEPNAGGMARSDPRYRPNRYTIVRGDTIGTPDVDPGVTPGASRGDNQRDPGVTLLSPKPSIEPSDEPSQETPASLALAAPSEARRLCDLLADRIEANGSRRPTVTETWVRDMDRMMRLDERTPTQVQAAIEWCQADEFWRANILSPSTLRRQYDRMRLQARQRRGGNRIDNNLTNIAASVEREGRSVLDLLREQPAQRKRGAIAATGTEQP